jgi:NAD(P)-dependent dehydrogenase (short-subunit alcohol dehydrogenase family)
MELIGKHVVVTGAASGIGRAMAVRFARERPRGLVVADLDVAGVEALAAELAASGASVLATGCDVSRAEEVEQLIDLAEATFGPVDLFCANAGVGGGTTLEETSDLQWRDAYDVNVLSHVVAARRLVPGWVERGEGYFLSTASAAGLLTMVGGAAYAATKHAAVAFAEWLAFTYADRGVRVSCLCPMGVQTKLLEEALAEPGEAGLGMRMVTMAGPVLDPAGVAEAVVDGLAAERFLILPHPQVQQLVEDKAADRDAWIARMSAVRSAMFAAT